MGEGKSCSCSNSSLGLCLELRVLAYNSSSVVMGTNRKAYSPTERRNHRWLYVQVHISTGGGVMCVRADYVYFLFPTQRVHKRGIDCTLALTNTD